jgi:hypothetical protein
MLKVDDGDQQVYRVMIDVLADSEVEKDEQHNQNEQWMKKTPEEAKESALVSYPELRQGELTDEV